MSTGKAVVGIIMGGQSDWPQNAARVLDELQVPSRRASSPAPPARHLYEYAKSAKARGLKVIIAGRRGRYLPA
jgi:5-(carboxyamino)imidazole ribonucleotide mutase